MQFFTSCYFISNNFGNFPLTFTNPVFAASAPAGLGVNLISPSDFTISQYKPFVTNNVAAAITAPSGTMVSQPPTPNPTDDGGADIVISYAPNVANGDPVTVNFLQAYIEAYATNNGNLAAYSSGTIDTATNSPYYNSRTFLGATGTGMTNMPGTLDLSTYNPTTKVVFRKTSVATVS